MKWLVAFLVAGLAFAQPATPPPSAAELEQEALNQAVTEAGSSAVDLIRALEKHLTKYPQSPQRAAIDKALAKSAMEASDRARIIVYGERVLAAEPSSVDLPLLDRVARALLDSDDAEPAKKALTYARRYLAAVESMRGDTARGHMTESQWGEEVNRGRARALVLQARATGNAGDAEEALSLARQSWGATAGAESGWEVAKWLINLKRENEALEYLANAFTIEDSRATEADRARSRTRLGEIYTKLNGSEKGLGDLILAAYDRMSSMRREHLAGLRSLDPNTGATEILEFTLLPVSPGKPLALSALKGKTVVMDFWATWCGPCRVQHPMVDNVRKRYLKDDSVVFLSVDSDDDHTSVAAFLKDMKWEGANYYESGLARLLNVSSIPTLLVVNREGKVASRMTGFIPERFEEMLVERIEETRAN